MSHRLYASGGRGLIRYFFLHGCHERTNFASKVAVEARILSFTQSGELISDHSNDAPTRTYNFLDGSLTDADKSQGNIETSQIVQTLLKNISVPALVLLEVPREQVDFPPISDEPYSYIAVSMLGRSDLRICVGEERDYLEQMSNVFLPRFVQAMSSRSGDYLPGDAGNFCKQVAHGMIPLLDDGEFVDFLELYRQRYLGKSVMQKSEILEICLLHIIKIPFDLESSIRQGLIRGY